MSESSINGRSMERHNELWEQLLIQSEIIQIQDGIDTGDRMVEDVPALAIGASSKRISKERERVQAQIQDAIVDGDLLEEWTTNKLREKHWKLQHFFELLSDSHDGEICDVTWDIDDEDTLLGRIVSTIPWYDFRGTKVKLYISSHDRMFDVVFLDDSWDEIQRFWLADFYADFMWHY